MNTAWFWILYLVFMIPTYFISLAFFVLPLGSTTILKFVCLFVLVVVGLLRGLSIGKPWLVVFPIIALLFDVFLFFIPFVPTLMHILTLVLGSIDKMNKQVSTPEQGRKYDYKVDGILGTIENIMHNLTLMLGSKVKVKKPKPTPEEERKRIEKGNRILGILENIGLTVGCLFVLFVVGYFFLAEDNILLDVSLWRMATVAEV